MTQRRAARQIAAQPRIDAEGWRQHAACSGLDPSLFFAEGTTEMVKHHTEAAKQVCAACPVRRACLSFAVATNQQFGLWGGHDPVARRSLRRTWRAALRNRPDLADDLDPGALLLLNVTSVTAGDRRHSKLISSTTRHSVAGVVPPVSLQSLVLTRLLPGHYSGHAQGTTVSGDSRKEGDD